MNRASWLLSLVLAAGGCGSSAGTGPDLGVGDLGAVDGGNGCTNLTLSAASETTPGQCTDYNPLRNVYWGDLHDHTAFSIDSYGLGNRRTPLDAYQFAMGVCTNVLGIPTQIDRPLDFVVVSDHSEYIGAVDECFNLDGKGWSGATTPYCQIMQGKAAQPWPQSNLIPFMAACGCVEGDTACIENPDGGAAPAIERNDPTTYQAAAQSIWQLEVKTADDVYAANHCKFTPLAAYEWTASPMGNTMHHIVVFANSTVPAVPLDYLHYDSEYALLSGLQAQCTGQCDVITIQHNTNLSGGVAWITAGTTAVEQLRVQYERLVEMHQSKGNSECLNDAADGNDPLCGFEYRIGKAGETPAQVAPGYVRAGLGKGIADWAVNHRDAYQLGFVGATDNHQATPGNVRESTWIGSVANGDNLPEHRLTTDQNETGTANPGGITGVWAEQNLRPNVFAALKRRETFATSGPRIAVRFYQTWDQTTDFCADPGFPTLIEKDIAANGGAIMGGTIVPATAPPAGVKPRFVVFALRDPLVDPTSGGAADLQEVQLVKGVYDPTAGATTVTLQSQAVQSPPAPHETGASFCHTFTDAGWDATKATYYYPRVLQVPTWRWSHYDCQAVAGVTTDAGVSPCDAAKQDVKIQERAWGSPVWYLP
ncbi:MAG TPA: DUF3604 domain-containing protein [Polyangia bacterium]